MIGSSSPPPGGVPPESRALPLGWGPTVALATSVDWPDLAPDDRALIPALARLGINAECAIWTDPRIRWQDFELIVVRSCWDYHNDLSRWVGWIDDIKRRGLGPRLCNPPGAMVWNCRKTYLADLEALGVPIVPTRWLAEPDLASWATFKAALEATGWGEMVCKPSVSAGALATFRLRIGELSSSEAALLAALPELARRGPVMLQPFLPDIILEGEWSLLFFDGRLSHSVLKRSRPGDFRVQEKHGGDAISREPPAVLVDAAQRALAAASQVIQSGPGEIAAPFLYARVDLVIASGTALLMELELVEPALFLLTAPSSASPADRLASAAARRIAALQTPTGGACDP